MKIETRNELAILLEENSIFREAFERDLWNGVLKSEKVDGNYSLCYDLSNQTFAPILEQFYENDKNIIHIDKVDTYFWDFMYEQYDAFKYVEGNVLDFHEWMNEAIKEEYIENKMDSLIKRLQNEDEYEI